MLRRLTAASVRLPRLSAIVCLRLERAKVRIDHTTHKELKRLAAELGATVGQTVAIAVRGLREESFGEELPADLTETEVEWLDADLG